MPQPMQVAQTTSTVSKTAFMPFSPLLMPISPSRVSREYGSLAEHRPMRSTRTPNACSCWATLSQPLLLKADASTGPRLVFSHSQMIAEAVVVFPVPGGPWIKVKRCLHPAKASDHMGRSKLASSLHQQAHGELDFGHKDMKRHTVPSLPLIQNHIARILLRLIQVLLPKILALGIVLVCPNVFLARRAADVGFRVGGRSCQGIPLGRGGGRLPDVRVERICKRGARQKQPAEIRIVVPVPLAEWW